MGRRHEARFRLGRWRQEILPDAQESADWCQGLRLHSQDWICRSWYRHRRSPALRPKQLLVNGAERQLRELDLSGNYRHEGDENDDNAEWVVPVEWIRAVPQA